MGILSPRVTCAYCQPHTASQCRDYACTWSTVGYGTETRGQRRKSTALQSTVHTAHRHLVGVPAFTCTIVESMGTLAGCHTIYFIVGCKTLEQRCANGVSWSDPTPVLRLQGPRRQAHGWWTDHHGLCRERSIVAAPEAGDGLELGVELHRGTGVCKPPNHCQTLSNTRMP